MQQGIPDNVWICRTPDEVERIVKDNRLSLVKLGATWCGPCKAASSAYMQLAADYHKFPNIAFMSVDIDQNPMYNEKISAVPAFVFYVDGKIQPDLMQLGADMQSVRGVVENVIQELNRGGKEVPETQQIGAQVPLNRTILGSEYEGVTDTPIQRREVAQKDPHGYQTNRQHRRSGYATHSDSSQDLPGPRMSSYTRNQ